MSKFGHCLKIVAAAVSVLTLSYAGAQVTKSGSGYLLRIKHVKGTKLNYKLTSETTNAADPKQTQKMTAPLKMTVLDVTKGVATIKIESGPFTANGKTLSNKTNSMQVKMDSRGKMIGGGAASSQLSGVQLPEKPIKIGESFDFTNTVSMGQAPSMTVKSHCTLAGIKTVNGRQAAEIKVTMNSSGFIPINGQGSQFIDVADGQLLSAEINQQMSTTAGGTPMKITSKIKIDRQGAR